MNEQPQKPSERPQEPFPKPRVGVIGLGIMGGAMGSHIAAAGFKLCGFDIDSAKRHSFAGESTESVSDVIAHSDVVLLSLPSAGALDEVSEQIAEAAEASRKSAEATEAAAASLTSGERHQVNSSHNAERAMEAEATAGTAAEWVTEAAKTPRGELVAVEMGTLPLKAKHLAQRRLEAVGVDLLDAPVSGTGLQAADATLVVYASGSREAYEAASPVFDVISARRYHLGEFGNGTRMKFVANLLVAVNTLAAAEAHALGAAAGLPSALTQEVIGAGVGSSRMFEIRGPMMVEGRYEPAARLSTIFKDASIISDFARGLGVNTPLLDAALPLYQQGSNGGLGDLDAAALRLLLSESQAEMRARKDRGQSASKQANCDKNKLGKARTN